jgi:choline dehydrogenase-like flavoprotein
MLGGRTNHWARNSFRMGEYDFKPYTRDGLGVDWPVEYKDIAPWYDKTEKLVGVAEPTPGLKTIRVPARACCFRRPVPRAGRPSSKRAAMPSAFRTVPARRAVLSRKIDERQACYWASGCGRGCGIGAAFQTTTSLIRWARKTGKLTIATGAMVYEVMLDASGKASGVRYIDRATGTHKEAKGRVIVLAIRN